MENVLFEEKYIQRFLQDLKQNKLSHGYLIISPDRLFNEIVATQMAAILLCKNKDKVEVEYALRDLNKPIGISEYKLTDAIPDNIKSKLPSIEELENKLEE